MLLILIRHADAGSRDAQKWPDDSRRPISGLGRKQQLKMSRRLRRRGYVPGMLLASPWLRAWQTAGLVASEFEAEGLEPEACDALATLPRIERLAEAVGAPGEEAIVALVGHDPWISELASQLLVGKSTLLSFDFPKSGIIGIELDRVESGTGQLVFFWRPKGE
jgi:phosphohistidine phosphatase